MYKHKMIRVVLFASILLCSKLEAQDSASSALCQSWIDRDWHQSLTFDEISAFAGSVSNDPSCAIVLVPIIDIHAEGDHTGNEKSLQLVLARCSTSPYRRDFCARVKKSVPGCSQKDCEGLYQSLVRTLEDDRLPCGLRTSSASTLLFPDSLGAIFLPALVLVETVLESRSEKGVIIDSYQIKNSATKILSQTKKGRRLCELLRLRIRLSNYLAEKKTNVLLLDDITPDFDAMLYPYSLPKQSLSRTFTTDLKVRDVSIGGAQYSISPEFTTDDLLDSFRTDELGSLARSTYSRFLEFTIKDFMQICKTVPDVADVNRSYFRTLAWHGVISDDVNLAANCVGLLSDFKRNVDQEFPDRPFGALDAELIRITRLVYSDRPYIFSRRTWDLKEIAGLYRARVEELTRSAETKVSGLLNEPTGADGVTEAND